MRVIVCGAGQVGSSIARQLAGEANDVTVIDNDPEIVHKLAETAEVRCLVGGASLPDVLDEAGAKNAGVLAVQILALSNKNLHQKLIKFKNNQAKEVERKSRKLKSDHATNT